MKIKFYLKIIFNMQIILQEFKMSKKALEMARINSPATGTIKPIDSEKTKLKLS